MHRPQHGIQLSREHDSPLLLGLDFVRQRVERILPALLNALACAYRLLVIATRPVARLLAPAFECFFPAAVLCLLRVEQFLQLRRLLVLCLGELTDRLRQRLERRIAAIGRSKAEHTGQEGLRHVA